MWGGWAQNKVAEKQKDYNCIDLDDFSALDKVAEQDGQSDDRHAGQDATTNDLWDTLSY